MRLCTNTYTVTELLPRKDKHCDSVPRSLYNLFEYSTIASFAALGKFILLNINHAAI